MPYTPVLRSPLLVMLLLLVGWSTLPGTTAAQVQPAPERTIQFDEAVRIALDQNTTLRRAINQSQRQDINVLDARMDFVPNLQLSSGTQRSFGRSFSQEEGGIVNETTDFFNTSVSTSVNVFNGFQDVASLEEANLQSQATDLDLQRTRQDVVFTVMEQFIGLVEAQEIVRVREEELDVQEQQLERVREFVEVGSQPRSDLFQQQALTAEAEQQLLSAEREVELGTTRLIQTLQLDPLADYNFEAPALDDASLAVPEYDLNRLLQNAFEQRADLQAAEFDMRAADQGVRIAQSGYYPSISIGGQYGSSWSSQAFFPNNPDPSFFDVLDNRRGGSFSISLSFPIFDRLQTRNNVQRARAERLDAEYQRDDQRQQVAVQVRQAYLDVQNAAKQLDVAEARLQAAERARDAAQERYNLGSATFVELAQANADFVSAASGQVQARYNLVFQKKLVDYYLGVLNPQGPLF